MREDPALAEWEQLQEAFKESNRQRAEHIVDKLKQIGCSVQAVSEREIQLIVFSDAEIETLAGHTDWVRAVDITPDGRYAVSGSHDHTVKVWDLTTGGEVRTLSGHQNQVIGVAVLSGRRWVASSSEDGTLRLWDLSTGRQVCQFDAGVRLRSCAACPDGHTILAGDAEGRVYVLMIESL